MAKAKQLPSGNWHVSVYAGKAADGKRIYKSFTESTERKANLAALKWQEHHKEISRDESKMTVKEAIDAHITSMSNILSPSTIAGYKRHRDGHMDNIINTQLCKLTNKAINDEINREAKTCSPKTIKNVYGLLKTVLLKYRLDFECDFSLPVVYPTIQNIPLDDDVRKIYTLAYDTEMEMPILFACWLGLRVSEIRGLKVSKIMQDKVIIDSAIVEGENGAVTKKTKTRTSTRVLPLPVYIKKRADRLLNDGREYVTSLSGQAIYKRFVNLCNKAGVGPFRFHDLRHTNASIMLEENVPDKYIAERGGWGSDIYKKRYEHTTVNKHLSVNEQLDTRFGSMFSIDMQHNMQYENDK